MYGSRLVTQQSLFGQPEFMLAQCAGVMQSCQPLQLGHEAGRWFAVTWRPRTMRLGRCCLFDRGLERTKRIAQANRPLGMRRDEAPVPHTTPASETNTHTDASAVIVTEWDCGARSTAQTVPPPASPRNRAKRSNETAPASCRGRVYARRSGLVQSPELDSVASGDFAAVFFTTGVKDVAHHLGRVAQRRLRVRIV